jgi:hypothetical protein
MQSDTNEQGLNPLLTEQAISRTNDGMHKKGIGINESGKLRVKT